MSTPSESPLVEDLEPPSSSSQTTAAASNDETPSKVNAASSEHGDSAKPKPTPSTTSTSNGKRQRTLFDMLGPGSAPSQNSEASSKKPKLVASAASGSRNKLSTSGTAQSSSGAGGSDGQQPLNSIPFSLSEYVASLTEDQKRLLKLECETMGKSW
jgi:uracil-DNA glycosylase